jgi:4-hydroxy-3-methylbut-2-enyl diphosphate reductase
VVLKLQNRIREIDAPENQIILLGTLGHPEVVGLVGQSHQAARFVVSSPEEVEKLPLDPSRPTYLFSQTTKAPALFQGVVEKLLEKVPTALIADTLCRQVSNREPHLKAFAESQDVILFVAGQKSSNGKALFSVCKASNTRSYYISSPEEVQVEWLKSAQRIGLSGATSTPQWLMERVKAHVESLLACVEA